MEWYKIFRICYAHHRDCIIVQRVEFEKAGSLLSQTMKQLGVLSKTERGRNYLFYTVTLLVVIVFVYFLRALF